MATLSENGDLCRALVAFLSADFTKDSHNKRLLGVFGIRNYTGRPISGFLSQRKVRRLLTYYNSINRDRICSLSLSGCRSEQIF